MSNPASSPTNKRKRKQLNVETGVDKESLLPNVSSPKTRKGGCNSPSFWAALSPLDRRIEKSLNSPKTPAVTLARSPNPLEHSPAMRQLNMCAPSPGVRSFMETPGRFGLTDAGATPDAARREFKHPGSMVTSSSSSSYAPHQPSSRAFSFFNVAGATPNNGSISTRARRSEVAAHSSTTVTAGGGGNSKASAGLASLTSPLPAVSDSARKPSFVQRLDFSDMAEGTALQRSLYGAEVARPETAATSLLVEHDVFATNGASDSGSSTDDRLSAAHHHHHHQQQHDPAYPMPPLPLDEDGMEAADERLIPDHVAEDDAMFAPKSPKSVSGSSADHSPGPHSPVPKAPASNATGSAPAPTAGALPNGQKRSPHRATGGAASTTHTTAPRRRNKSNSSCKMCNCKKSKCLKLYCECFQRQSYCQGCNCVNCHNTPEYEEDRQKAVQATLDRDPLAFFRAQTSTKEEDGGPRKGCHCKKSACLKKYCECYQAGLPCSEMCKCVECKNHQTSSIDYQAGKRKKRRALKPSPQKQSLPSSASAPLLLSHPADVPASSPRREGLRKRTAYSLTGSAGFSPSPSRAGMLLASPTNSSSPLMPPPKRPRVSA